MEPTTQNVPPAEAAKAAERPPKKPFWEGVKSFLNNTLRYVGVYMLVAFAVDSIYRAFSKDKRGLRDIGLRGVFTEAVGFSSIVGAIDGITDYAKVKERNRLLLTDKEPKPLDRSPAPSPVAVDKPKADVAPDGFVADVGAERISSNGDALPSPTAAKKHYYDALLRENDKENRQEKEKKRREMKRQQEEALALTMF